MSVHPNNVGCSYQIRSSNRSPISRSVVHVKASVGSVHRADHPETRNRCAGRVQESVGANIASCSM